MIWARLPLLVMVLGVSPAQAQRPACGFGLGLSALQAADRMLAATPPALTAGREAAEQASASLAEAAERFNGCGCPQVAELTQDAHRTTEPAMQATDHSSLRQALDRARFSLRLARERLSRHGCT